MSTNEQTEPVQDGSQESTREARIEGIVQQVKNDSAVGNAPDLVSVLRQRLHQAGITLDQAELELIEARARR